MSAAAVSRTKASGEPRRLPSLVLTGVLVAVADAEVEDALVLEAVDRVDDALVELAELAELLLVVEALVDELVAVVSDVVLLLLLAVRCMADRL